MNFRLQDELKINFSILSETSRFILIYISFHSYTHFYYRNHKLLTDGQECTKPVKVPSI